LKARRKPLSERTRLRERAKLRRLLLVEDDPDLQVIASFALKRGGFELEICGDGREALEKTARFAPDLILLDVMLPFMDGPSILAELRKQPGLSGTPVVFMTARAYPEELMEYRRLGALDIIVKPFDPMTLAETLVGIWDRHHRERDANEKSALLNLETSYLSQLAPRVREIGQVVKAVQEAGGRLQLDSLFHLSHRLTGSSATLGFHRVSEAARALEGLALACREDTRLMTERERHALAGLMRELRAAAAAAQVARRRPATREGTAVRSRGARRKRG
jgi:two-component system, OmpR family, response regulator